MNNSRAGLSGCNFEHLVWVWRFRPESGRKQNRKVGQRTSVPTRICGMIVSNGAGGRVRALHVEKIIWHLNGIIHLEFQPETSNSENSNQSWASAISLPTGSIPVMSVPSTWYVYGSRFQTQGGKHRFEGLHKWGIPKVDALS